MDIMWSLGGWLQVSDVLAAMDAAEGEKLLAYSTVKTVMQNLADKRHLKKKSAGRANVFTPMVTRDDFQRSMIDDVFRPLMKTQRNPLLAHIAGELVKDDATLAEFEKLLAEKRAERQRA
jgi:predicted transcriptional regulator